LHETPDDRRNGMKFLCLAYEEEKALDDLSRSEWDVLRGETLAYVEILRKTVIWSSPTPCRVLERPRP
jgi:hypothetical protein